MVSGRASEPASAAWIDPVAVGRDGRRRRRSARVLEDLVVGNGSASELQGNNATYTVTITPEASGTVTVDIAAGAAQDSAGNPSATADQFSIVADLTPVPALPMAGAIALAVLLLVGGVRRWAAS